MPTLLETGLAELASAAPFDAVIVGAGSAGLTTATTLTEAGQHVALIEAGPVPFLTNLSNCDLRFASRLGRNLRDAVRYSPDLSDGGEFGINFSCFGGRGLFWNGAAPRFRAHDFDGWPLTLSDLDDGYAWAEDQFRVSRRVGQTDLAQRMIARLQDAGFAAEPGPFAVDDSPLSPGRLSAGIASGLGLFFRHAGQAVLDGQLKVATKTQVTQVLISDDQAAGVTAAADGTEMEVPARSVVLAAGGIESIKLALLSGVNDPQGRIGKGLQDHHFYYGLFSNPYLYEDRADNAVVYVPSRTQVGHQWEIHAPGDRLFAVDDGTPWRPDDSEPYRLLIRSFAPTEKRDENQVEPLEGPLGSSIVHFTYSPEDEKLRDQIMESAGLLTAALELQPTDDDGVDGRGRFRGPGASYHEAGGLDMGTSPASSVTDPDGRFHRTPNLVCADAAAFPRIGATNPHLTIVALARRKALALARSLS